MRRKKKELWEKEALESLEDIKHESRVIMCDLYGLFDRLFEDGMFSYVLVEPDGKKEEEEKYKRIMEDMKFVQGVMFDLWNRAFAVDTKSYKTRLLIEQREIKL